MTILYFLARIIFMLISVTETYLKHTQNTVVLKLKNDKNT